METTMISVFNFQFWYPHLHQAPSTKDDKSQGNKLKTIIKYKIWHKQTRQNVITLLLNLKVLLDYFINKEKKMSG